MCLLATNLDVAIIDIFMLAMDWYEHFASKIEVVEYFLLHADCSILCNLQIQLLVIKINVINIYILRVL